MRGISASLRAVLSPASRWAGACWDTSRSPVEGLERPPGGGPNGDRQGWRAGEVREHPGAVERVVARVGPLPGHVGGPATGVRPPREDGDRREPGALRDLC